MPSASDPVLPDDKTTWPLHKILADFGSTGDRRDKKGRLWLQSRSASHGLLALKYNVGIEGGRDNQRSSVYTPIENGDPSFVFATSRQGLEKCTIPIAEDDKGGGKFKVGLGFSALPGDKPGRRVFDVKLDGKTVLKDFDIIKETGSADTAVWKDVTISLGKELVLELVPKVEKPTADQMPLINAIQVLRQE